MYDPKLYDTRGWTYVPASTDITNPFPSYWVNQEGVTSSNPFGFTVTGEAIAPGMTPEGYVEAARNNYQMQLAAGVSPEKAAGLAYWNTYSDRPAADMFNQDFALAQISKFAPEVNPSSAYSSAYDTYKFQLLNDTSNEDDFGGLGGLIGLGAGILLGPAGLSLMPAWGAGMLGGALGAGLSGGNPLTGAFLGGIGGYAGGELFGGGTIDPFTGEALNSFTGNIGDWVGGAGNIGALPLDQVGALSGGGDMGWLSDLALQDFLDFGITGVESLGDALNYATGAADATYGISTATQAADFLRGLGMDTNTALSVVNTLGGSGLSPSNIVKTVLGNSGGAGGLLGTAARLGGQYLTGNAAVDAARTAANAQIEAARIAADAAKFRPVGVTTRFGQSQFEYDPITGNLKSAGYTLSPEVKAMQDRLMMAAGGGGMLTNTNIGNTRQYSRKTGRTDEWGNSIIPETSDTPMSGYVLNPAWVEKQRSGSMTMDYVPQYIRDTSQSVLSGTGMPDVERLVTGLPSNQNTLAADFVSPIKSEMIAPSNKGGSYDFLQQFIDSQAATAPMGAAAQRAMALGQGYLGTSPQEQAAKYMAEQQALLAPTREREYAALENRLMQQGRLGLATGATSTGMGAANPEIEALMNARRMQDLNLAAQATQGGMDYAKFGAGMVGTGGDLLRSMYGTQTAAYQPFQTALGGATGLEELGKGAMDIGTSIGAKTSTAAADAGRLMAQGMTNAAQTMQPANAYSPWGSLLAGTGDWLSKMSQPQQGMLGYDPTKYRLTPI